MEVIYQQLEERIKSIVGTKVCIQHKNKNKGKIEIEYYSLERLIDLNPKLLKKPLKSRLVLERSTLTVKK